MNAKLFGLASAWYRKTVTKTVSNLDPKRQTFAPTWVEATTVLTRNVCTGQ